MVIEGLKVAAILPISVKTRATPGFRAEEEAKNSSSDSKYIPCLHHVSTGLMTESRKFAAGLPISVETGPHYLAFSAEDVADGNTLLKCAPPIRDKANQLGLFRGLKVCRYL